MTSHQNCIKAELNQKAYKLSTKTMALLTPTHIGFEKILKKITEMKKKKKRVPTTKGIQENSAQQFIY